MITAQALPGHEPILRTGDTKPQNGTFGLRPSERRGGCRLKFYGKESLKVLLAAQRDKRVNLRGPPRREVTGDECRQH